MNRVKQDAINWDYIMDITYLGRTADADFAVMTGLLPDPREALAGSPHFRASRSAAPRAQALGYQTAAFNGYKRSFWNRAYAFPKYGIDELHFEERFSGQEMIGMGASDKAVFSYAAEIMGASNGKPFLSFVISLSSHHPYIYVPAPYHQLYLPERCINRPIRRLSQAHRGNATTRIRRLRCRSWTAQVSLQGEVAGRRVE